MGYRAANEPCSPGDADREGFFCAPTDKWEVMPGEILNAQKGDVLLSPSCDGLVGSMLMALQPMQYYSHTGIMVEDRRRIFHATTPQGRTELYPARGETLPIDGFEPGPLKYGWPGGVEQTVYPAMHGEYRPDPRGYALEIKAFTPTTRSCGKDEATDVEILKAPLVVKPPPALDAQVRQTLHALADEALSPDYPTHYRFYAYTDAKIATARDATGDIAYRAQGPQASHSEWAVGSIPVVCSTLVYAAAHRLQEQGASFVLEGSGVEPSDEALRRGVVQGGDDGLYFYPEAERNAAGTVFKNKVAEKVENSSDFEWVFDVASDLSHQTTRCFAFDDCSVEAKDRHALNNDEEYRHVGYAPRAAGDGDTVSPDNIMLWDAPGDGPESGLYGHAERMLYSGSRWRRVYEWQRVAGSAALTVQVVHDDTSAPQEEALVALGTAIVGVERAGLTDAAGTYRFPSLSVGEAGTTYTVNASWVDDMGHPTEHAYHIHRVGTADVYLAPGAEEVVTLRLVGGDPNYRVFSFHGNVHVLDDDPEGGSENDDWTIQSREFLLNPAKKTDDFSVGGQGWCVDGEVATRLTGEVVVVDADAIAAGEVVVGGTTLAVQPTMLGTVMARLYARLWEGGKVWPWSGCEYGDDNIVDSRTEWFYIGRGETFPLDDWRVSDSGDYARYDLTLENQGEPGTFPLPEPGPDPSLDPKRRQVLIDSAVHLLDHDSLTPNESLDSTLHLEATVHPWDRKQKADGHKCVDSEVRGELHAQAMLLDDLETVRVTLTGVVAEGSTCHGAEECGHRSIVVDVPRDQAVTVPGTLRANCYKVPYLAPESDTYASFSEITLFNGQAPAP